MAAELVVNTERVQKFFDDLESQKKILSTCTQLFKTLTAHFNSLQESLSEKHHSLESKFQSLESHSRATLASLADREGSIPDRESDAVARIAERKDSALAEFENRIPANSELSESLKSFSRRMDSSGLVKFIVSKRKESVSLRAAIGDALSEAVDPPRLVIDSLEEFVNSKSKKVGVTDRRWACGMLVQALFLERNSAKKGPCFARSVVDRAAKVLEQWKAQIDSGELGGASPGAAEAVMFVQMVVGFRLRKEFDEEFLRRIMMEHAARRDMARLATQLEDKEQMEDIIDELVKNGKEIEAIYFASESGLTERFSPVALLKSFLQNFKKNATDILKKGNNSLAAMEESSNLELNSIKAIIKCVEDHKLESEFSLGNLRKRLAHLEKSKAERKKGSAGSSKPQNKRGHSASSGRGGGGSSSFRPAKAARYSNTYSSFSHRNANLPAHRSPAAARYSGPFNYPVQNVYNAAAPSPYASTYGVSHAQSPTGVPQQHYSHLVDNMSGAAFRGGGSYNGQTSYGAFDYSNSGPPSYQPSPYPK